MPDQQHSMNLDFSREIAQLGELTEFGRTQLAADPQVSRQLILAVGHVLAVIKEKAAKQAELYSLTIIPRMQAGIGETGK